MKVYPVILCGGGGTRLWPASRPSRPKQFLPMSGNRSLFQDAVVRTAPLAGEDAAVIVVGGVAHRRWILDQLAEVGIEAQVLLEPEARDSAAAMAAAAAWIHRQDPDGVAAFVASDHHIPDHDAFRSAVAQAAQAAASGRLVTLGVKPDAPSTAYGYIQPAGPGLSVVSAFVEKPDRATALAYIAAGYLWNSGNFIVSAAALLTELETYAPGVAAAAQASLPPFGKAASHLLGPEFAASPKISIDYAVMEKTQLACVLETDFVWSDMGAWDAIASSGEGNLGSHIFEDSDGCLVRAPDGVMVAALGVRNLAIIAEGDAILVADLARSQDMKRVVQRIGLASPRHLDFHAPAPESLADGGARLADWLRLRALPLWSTVGLDPTTGFAESLGLDGRRLVGSSRSLVQARQIYVYAQAGRLGWTGPWRSCVEAGLKTLDARFRDPQDALIASLSADGTPLDARTRLYDQSFVLLSLATAKAAGVADVGLQPAADRMRQSILDAALPQGGFREVEPHPYQANAHMHLLEASMAWEDAGGDDAWAALSDAIVDHAVSRFVDPSGFMLREFFDQTWSPASGDDGRLVEPGHQFEWSWLLTRYARSRSRADIGEIARKLYDTGRRGVEERSGVVQDALNDDGSIRSSRARLWPQTEWLKAALILSEDARDGRRAGLISDAEAALRALHLYLTPNGLWRDKRLPIGDFVDEAAPASSFYHLMAAFTQLAAHPLKDLPHLTLA